MMEGNQVQPHPNAKYSGPQEWHNFVASEMEKSLPGIGKKVPGPSDISRSSQKNIPPTGQTWAGTKPIDSTPQTDFHNQNQVPVWDQPGVTNLAGGAFPILAPVPAPPVINPGLSALSPEQKREMWSDIKKIGNIITGGMFQDEPPSSPPNEPSAPITKTPPSSRPEEQSPDFPSPIHPGQGIPDEDVPSIGDPIEYEPHKKRGSKNPSKKPKHEAGKRRKNKDKKGGEKGDARRPYQR